MNRVYFFTGTGNSLEVAEKIGKELSDCEIVAIQKGTSTEIAAGYERLGFVFPSYAGGPPALVADFIRNIKIPKQDTPYLFSVVTYGGNARDIQALVAHQFDEKGLKLNYSAKIMSYPNVLPAYRMALKLINQRTKKGTNSVIKNILHKQSTPNMVSKESARQYYENYMKSIHDGDKNYSINSNCISCGICKNVCPAQNITMENKKPTFHHNCESCLACMNYCPRHAINIGDKGQNKKRYTHPEVEYKQIIKYYK